LDSTLTKPNLHRWGIVNSFSIPIDASVARQGDSGVPFVKKFPDSAVANVYRQLAEAVVCEVTKMKESARYSIYSLY
jgi:MinD-like ATPase involved in chromosome partitioning or flagellar assembly